MYTKGTGDLVHFQDKLTKHFNLHGMDSIAHVQDPLDFTTMLHIVDNHPCYTIGKVINQMTNDSVVSSLQRL